MEAQLHRPTTQEHHLYQEDPHLNAPVQSVMEGEGEKEHTHQGEKKSVLKKVKDKAKKLKDKIKNSHGEEDHGDEVEETVVASDAHAALINEDAFISGTNLPKQTGPNLENQTTPLEKPIVTGNTGVIPNVKHEVNPLSGTGRAGITDLGPNLKSEMDPLSGTENAGDTDLDPNMKREVLLGMNDPLSKTFSPMEEEPYNSSIKREKVYTPMEKVYSGVGDVGSGLGKMEEKPQHDPDTEPFDPLPTSTHAGDSERRVNVAEPVVKVGPLTDLEKDPHSPGQVCPPNYQTKVVDPTGKGGAEADVGSLVDRLGDMRVGDKLEERSHTGSHDQFAPESTPMEEQFDTNPEAEPKSLDSETLPRDTVAGKITSLIADKASSARDVVASKLGYGSDQSQEGEKMPSKPTALESGKLDPNPEAEPKDLDAETMPRETVTGKITSLIADKALSAKDVVASKLGYGQSQEGDEPVKTTAPESGGAARGSDKGVSVQEYLSEKLSPGEEDKELSKAITDAIHRKKERGAGEEGGEVKESIRIEAVASDEKAAAGVVDRVKGAIGSWLGQHGGEVLEKEETTTVKETGK